MKKICLMVLFTFCSSFLFSQAWLKNLPKQKAKENLTFFDYKNAFESYWAPFHVDGGYYMENGVKKKAVGWKQYKRWEYYMETQIDPVTGSFPTKTAEQVYEEYLSTTPQQKSKSLASWTSLGTSSSTGGYTGIGRISCIAFHPTDNNTYWVGAASGGLWVTTNNGTSWTCLTDHNGVLAVSDIIIPTDYATTNTIYIATGDRDAWDNRSVGVLKSTDGGATWNTTGLNFTLSSANMVNRLLVDPNNNQILIAATRYGVYKTTNGGTTWSQQIATYNFIDMEYKPGDFNTLYGSAESGLIYVSSNGGTTWTQVFSNSAIYRIELAVSANQPTWVYALAENNSDDGLYGVYKSIDNGATYTQVYAGTTKNLLGWVAAGNDTGGQGWYDLSLAVSPTNANTLLVGGINTWRSTDIGASWTIVNHWSGSGAQAVHADKHMLKFRSNGDLFECNDGGVYISTNTGTSWTDKTNGMVTSQMYKLSNATTSATEVITGLQDNGTKLLYSGAWHDVKGGDGMECIIDYTTVNTQYGTYVQGQISRTTNHWTSSTDISANISGNHTGAWVTPYIIDPLIHTTLYAGYADVWKTTDQGTTWTKISTMNSSNLLRSMAIAPSNTQVLYVADETVLWKTANGGTSWTNITGTLPSTSGNITSIAVKNDDANTLWVTLGGYTATTVYQSINGGTTWTNISTGLPSIPAYTIVQNKQSTTEVQLYVGTELGIYFKKGSDNWISYNTGLPNVRIGEIEIYYATVASSSKLRAATYGRGLWETPVYSSGIPVITATATPSTICLGASSSLTASSTETGTTYIWMPGSLSGSPVSVNPASTTTYTVTGTAGGNTGSTTVTVTVNPLPVITPTATPGTICNGASSSLAATSSINPATFTWVPGNLTGTPVTVTPASVTTYSVTGTVTSTGCTGTSAVLVTVIPNITPTFNPVAAICSGATLAALPTTSLNSIKGTWAPALNNTTTTTYTFTPTAGQCATTNTLIITVNPNITPTFNPIAAICSGATLAALPTTSLNGITGSWTPALSNTLTTTYTFTPTAGLCATTTTLTITVNPNITPTFNPISPICSGATLTALPTTSTNGYTGTWAPVLNNTATTTYTFTPNAGQCATTNTLIITVNPKPVITPTATPAAICNGASSSLSAISTVVGTTYNWTPGNLSGSPVTVSPTSNTTYTVTGTAAGCTGSASVTVTVNSNPVLNPVATPLVMCRGDNSVLSVSSQSNTTYLWMPGSLIGASPSNIHPVVTTIYTVTGTNSITNCTASATVTLTVNQIPTFTALATPSITCSNGSSTLSTNCTANCTGITYTWMPGSLAGSSVSVHPLVITTYTVTATNSNNCTLTSTVSLTVNPNPVITPTATPATICNGTSSSLSASSTITGTTYVWNPGGLAGTPVSISPGSNTTYTVSGTVTATGCTGMSTVTVNVNPKPVITPTANPATINSGASSSLAASSTVTGTTYVWNPGGLAGTPVSVSPGSTTTYTVTGTASGCTGSGSISVTVNQVTKTLQVKVFVEGLFIGGGLMRESSDFNPVNETFPLKWIAGVADTVTVVLYNNTYGAVVAKYPGVYLHTDGNLTIPGISSSLSNSYYITIFQRNSVPVTSATPRSFAGSSITYDFTYPADQAYGVQAQKSLSGGVYGMYSGELSKDAYWAIDGSDVTILEPDVINGTYGYLITDLNGDGVVDGSDMSIMDANVVFGPIFWNPLLAKKKQQLMNQNK